MYGVIDIGSNTIRLVVYERTNGRLEQILNKKITAGLAGYINKNHEMRNRGVEVAVESLIELKKVTDNLHLDGVSVFATAPLRNINNTEEVVRQIEEETGFHVQVLSGRQEAAYGFAGLRGESSVDEGLMIDLGGGSAELVAFNHKDSLYSCSIPWGSLNLYRRYVKGITPTKKEIEAIGHLMKKQFEKVKFPEGCNTGLLCAEGGTARAVDKMIRAIYKDCSADESGRYSSKMLCQLLDDYCERPKHMADQILRVAPERIHTFVPGLVVLNKAVEVFGIEEVVTVGFGVREGFLIEACPLKPERKGTGHKKRKGKEKTTSASKKEVQEMQEVQEKQDVLEA